MTRGIDLQRSSLCTSRSLAPDGPPTMQVIELPTSGASRSEEGRAGGLQVGLPLGSLCLIALDGALGIGSGCEHGHGDATTEPMDGLGLSALRWIWRAFTPARPGGGCTRRQVGCRGPVAQRWPANLEHRCVGVPLSHGAYGGHARWPPPPAFGAPDAACARWDAPVTQLLTATRVSLGSGRSAE